ncbi:MAG: ribosome silencing factor [Eubacterium sp.]
MTIPYAWDERNNMENNYIEIVKTAVKAIDSKRGDDIEVIKVSSITVLTDYFVIATAGSNTQLKAIADEVEFKLSQQGIEPHHIEGEKTEWICLDYIGVVVHILLKDKRDFYQIERLWEDGEKVDIDNLIIKE